MTGYRIPLSSSGSAGNITLTSYIALGNTTNSFLPAASKDEVLTKFFGTGFLLNLRINISSNASSTTTVLRLIKNGSPTTITISIPSGTSGFFEDTTNVVAVSDGDVFYFELEKNDASAIAPISYTIDYFTASGKTKYTTSQCAVIGTDSAVRYFKFAGVPTYYPTVDSQSQQEVAVDGTIQNAATYVRANARGTTSTLTLQKNGIDTSIVLSVGAGVTGWVTDTSNTVSVVAGDYLTWKLTNGSGTGSMNWGSPTIELDPTTSGEACLITQTLSSLGNNQTRYVTFAGTSTNSISSAVFRLDVRGGATISDVRFNVVLNTATNSAVITARKNGSDQSITTTFATTVTGTQTDTTNSFTMASADYAEWKLVRASGSSGTFTPAWISYKYAADSEADPTIPTPGGGFLGSLLTKGLVNSRLMKGALG